MISNIKMLRCLLLFGNNKIGAFRSTPASPRVPRVDCQERKREIMFTSDVVMEYQAASSTGHGCSPGPGEGVSDCFTSTSTVRQNSLWSLTEQEDQEDQDEQEAAERAAAESFRRRLEPAEQGLPLPSWNRAAKPDVCRWTQRDREVRNGCRRWPRPFRSSPGSPVSPRDSR